MQEIKLIPLAPDDREQFIKDNSQQENRLCRVVRSGKAAPRGDGVGNRYALF